MEKLATINIPLTDELKKFVVSQTGKGTLYSTPSEYVRDLIRHEAERKKASNLRNSIIEGYQDSINGNVVRFSGNLKSDLAKLK
ncbi:MAG: CopG family transcriptional regulator [Flavobacteriales bacterium]|nr:CopG family transcriptional regulator [Flavobacteriales bacterium]